MARAETVDSRTVAERVLRREAGKMPALAKSVRETEDAESVHDLRVSIRRTRTAFRVFRSVLQPSIVELDAGLHDLFGRLGRVRELDVAIDSLGRRPNTVEICAKLNGLRTSAWSELRHAIGQNNVLGTFTRAARRLQSASEEALDLANAITDAHRKVGRSLKRIQRAWNIAEVHRMRRRLKRLRYTIEFFEPELGSFSKKYIDELKSLQDEIGREMDLVTLASLLASVGGLSDAGGEARRILLAELEMEIDSLRSNLKGVESSLNGKAFRNLRDRLEAI